MVWAECRARLAFGQRAQAAAPEEAILTAWCAGIATRHGEGPFHVDPATAIIKASPSRLHSAASRNTRKKRPFGTEIPVNTHLIFDIAVSLRRM
jgi:hypothetical protein